jgi:prophage antirepressor-like protein
MNLKMDKTKGWVTEEVKWEMANTGMTMGAMTRMKQKKNKQNTMAVKKTLNHHKRKRKRKRHWRTQGRSS